MLRPPPVVLSITIVSFFSPILTRNDVKFRIFCLLVRLFTLYPFRWPFYLISPVVQQDLGYEWTCRYDGSSKEYVEVDVWTGVESGRVLPEIKSNGRTLKSYVLICHWV